MADTFKSAESHPVFNKVLDELVTNQFFLENGLQKKIKPIDPQELRKANWLSSLLSLSEDEKHKQKSLIFSTIVYLQNKDNEIFGRNCYIAQSRTGNIPASSHINNLFSYGSNRFGTLLDLELGLQREAVRLTVNDWVVYTTKFQKNLWDLLHKECNISISAPTSSGKSFIIHNYIVEQCESKSTFRAVCVVPSRALIYQVSSSLKKRLYDKQISIRTGFGYSEETKYPQKEVIVVTPERCLKMLEIASTGQYQVDFIFIDEIQNVEDPSRGVLLEHIIKELHRHWPMAKMVTAGPFIENSKSVLTKMDISDIVPTYTTNSPVFQIKVVFTTIKGNRSELEANIISPTGNVIKKRVNIKKSLYTKVKQDAGNAFAEIIKLFGQDSHNIIYAPRTDSAENWALKIKEVVKENTKNNERVNELIQYLKEEVHPKYSLIRCLENGVAYHHSGLPDIARSEIEELYVSGGTIKNLVCTSTLLEGVNLPAQKMFIIRPNTGNIELSDFNFNNLIGRAGRMSEHLYGSIYCIETNDEPWGEEKLKSTASKNVTPATEKALTEELDQLKGDLFLDPRDIKHNDCVSYTISLLRHKFLKDPIETRYYLEHKKIPQQEIENILISLETSLKRITIPKELVYLNPTVDPILQDNFFNKIGESGVNNWLITAMPFHAKDFISIEEQRSLPFNEKNFYGQFEFIAERLNEIFDIESETNKNLYSRSTIRQIVKDAVPWIRGYSYRALIEKELDKLEDEEKVDLVIRRVTKSINQNVRFLMVKYFKLWSDILKYYLDNEAEKHKYILNLHNMLEMGTDNPKALELISKGITRTVALTLAKHIPNNYQSSLEEWIFKNARNKLPSIFVKHLISLGFGIK